MTVRDVMEVPRSLPDESSPDAAMESCANCGALLTGPYCSWCGQKHQDGELTLRDFFKDVARDFSHWDSKVPRTLKTLLLEPGRITREVLAGRRARWVAPLRLYVICSLVYFLARPLEEAIQHRSERASVRLVITNPDGSRVLTDSTRQSIAEGLPGRIYGVERLERAAMNSKGLDRTVGELFPKAMFALVPLFAALTRLAWRRKVPQYPAHLYLALHMHAAWFGVLALSTLLATAISSDALAAVPEGVALLYIAWYTPVAVRRVFGDSWIRTVAKLAVVMGVYMAALFTATLALLGYAITKV